MTKRSNIGDAEWQARVDLAAAYRLCTIYGWDNLIYNHISLRVPGEPDCFLLKQHSLLFEEVCASNLVKIRLDGTPMDETENVNAAGYTIHTAVLNARPDLNCTLHVHPKAGMAMAAHPDGILSMTQGAMRFHNRLSYHDYEGISTDLSESDRLARDLGPRNKSMILRNHGLLTAGVSVSEALTLMRYLIGACETQLMLQGAGVKPLIPPPEVCEHAAQQWEHHDANGGRDDWPAYLRVADRTDPSYRN